MADKAGPSPGHEHVNDAMQAHQRVGGSAVSGIDDADAASRHAGGDGGVVEYPGDGGAGKVRKRPAAQHDGVARFQANARSVGGDVGAGLVNDGDDAERHAHALKLDARIKRTALQNDVDGIGQLHQLFERRRHLLDASRVKREPVEQAFLDLCVTRGAHVFFVGGKDVGRVRAQGGRHRAQGIVALPRGRLRKRAACLLRRQGNVAHLIF